MKLVFISFSFALLLAVQAVPPPKYFVAPVQGFGGNLVLVPRSSVSVRQGCNMPETTPMPAMDDEEAGEGKKNKNKGKGKPKKDDEDVDEEVMDLSSTTLPVTSTQTTFAPVTAAPATFAPVTAAPATFAPVTAAPSTFAPVTAAPATFAPVTAAPATFAPVTAAPTTFAPVTAAPTTFAPATVATTPSSGEGGSGAPPTNPSGPPPGIGPCISCAVENFRLVNEYRVASGAEPVLWNDMLSDLSTGWSKTMFDENRLYHSDYPYAENAAVDYGPGINWDTIAQVFFESWQSSPDGHDENMKNTFHKCMGIGIYGDGTKFYATQMFTSNCP